MKIETIKLDYIIAMREVKSMSSWSCKCLDVEIEMIRECQSCIGLGLGLVCKNCVTIKHFWLHWVGFWEVLDEGKIAERCLTFTVYNLDQSLSTWSGGVSDDLYKTVWNLI